ncbi:MAG: SCP2 sterol-binding domain-containing protein [Acidobacteriia bacterium]|nr:SCP2 sterol-binding domain-containing protein [Methyloceanibacter sp.]MBX5471765.1 SCP2 sterol-binding domain-containing protein [Acetobacteraceae bacterium]MCL6491869.1 SCP2 sterol-binding domain-containing protein [Terriglobia bacterium]
MAEAEFPVLLVSNALALLPAPILERGIGLLLAVLARKHPRLFRTLAAHPPCAIGIEPIDLPHRFVLRYGGGFPSLIPTGTLDQPLNARVKGKLESLVGLLEGRLDSDTLFFSREIVITGDTETVLSLRNALERDSVDLFATAMALFGPASGLVQHAALALERRLVKTRRRLMAWHEALHAARREEASVAARCARLEAQLQEANARLAKLEARLRRRDLARDLS